VSIISWPHRHWLGNSSCLSISECDWPGAWFAFWQAVSKLPCLECGMGSSSFQVLLEDYFFFSPTLPLWRAHVEVTFLDWKHLGILRKLWGLEPLGRWVVTAPALLPSVSVIISSLQWVGSRSEEKEPSRAVNLKKWKNCEDWCLTAGSTELGVTREE